VDYQMRWLVVADQFSLFMSFYILRFLQCVYFICMSFYTFLFYEVCWLSGYNRK